MIIKIKYMLLIALVALVGCSSDEFVGDTGSPNGEAGSGNAAISFGFDVPQVTRAGGATAATALGNQFIVWGEKGEASTGAAYTTDDAAANTHQLVFKNYVVEYSGNTAYTTTSNTKDWEYVGITPFATNVSPLTGETTQTIKYWDYGASNYVFTAVSALPADISSGRVNISKTISGSTVYDKGYTITLAKTTVPDTYPSLDKIYLSDRLVISNAEPGSNREAVNKYGGNVTLTFRNLLSQVRAGVYETIPGYDIQSIKFYKTNNEEAKVGETSAFGAICPNVKIGGGFEGSLNVTYYGAGTAAENQPKVSVSGSSDSAADLILGTNMSTLSAELLLGKTAVAPTWDTANGDYTNVLPQSVDNTTNLQLKCDYTLWNSVTGETIEVKGATAVIPSQYLQWKSNFKYTYLFKISDNTNGSTGQDVTGLYPITFDAVEMVNGDGKAEYITTVSEPSITTFGAIYNTTETKYTAYQTGKNDYQLPGSTDKLDIYTTFMQGGTVLTPQLTGAAKANFVTVYVVDYKDGATEAEKAEKPITELSVANAIENTGGLITATAILTAENDYFSTAPAPVSSVPAEDGTTKDINALKLTGVKAAGKYAVEIITYKKLATKLTSEQSKVGYYAESSGTYTKQTEGVGDGSTDYYEQIKTYKVIKVVAP